MEDAMINAKMEKALNGQLNKEMYSAYLYSAMSAYATRTGLKGFATWFMVQYHEEMFHAMKIYEYIGRQAGTVRLGAIAEPPVDFGTPLDMFKKTLAHEQFITKSINDLMEIAAREKDHATQIFLQWYITEQIEEEENDNDIIAKLKLIGKDTNALFMLDKEVGARAVTIPTNFSMGVEAATAAPAA